jgi:hypothetical protein
MGSVFELLDDVRSRPGLYLGGDDTLRGQQLRDLEHLLSGYTLALARHAITERVTDINREFARYLFEEKGWSAACGPVAAVIEHVKSETEAWEVYWNLMENFRDAVDSR